MKHAKLSASASVRWLNCPGSVRMCEQYENKGSSFAQEGSAAHALAEMCLKGEVKQPNDLLGECLSDAPNVTVNKEMVDHVECYIDYVNSLVTKGSTLVVEERVDLSPWVKGGFGTSDAIILNDGTCHVVDLKYGQGVEVYAENNSQGMLYALGVLNEFEFIYDINKIVIHIYQPRRNHFDEWEITTKDLIKWGEWVKERALLTEQKDAELKASEKACQWCAHKANCTELKRFTEEVICSQFDDLDLPSPDSVDIGNVLKNKSLIESWLKAVEQSAYEKLMDGEDVPGYKLVEGRSFRKWASEQDAEKTLSSVVSEDDLYTKKLLSVSQAEKLIGKAKFKDELSTLVIKPEGKPTLAPVSDKRPPVGDVSCEFEKL